jgi:FSR family fosmidomycin resistance protein-like MFS transporter
MSRFSLKVLLLLSLGHLVTDVYQGALPALLPFLKEKLSLSYTATGAIMIASNLTSSILQPFFGYLSDKKEKGILLPLGVFAAGLGFSLLAWPQGYVPILLLVTISGLGVAAYHPEGYKTAHFFTGDRPATGMSIFSVGGNIGFALGPIAAISIVARLGLSWLPIMIIPSLLFSGVIVFMMKSLTLPTRSASEHASGGSRELPRGTIASLLLVIGVVVMRSWMQIGLMTYIPFYYIDYLKGDPLYAGKLVSVFLLGGALGTLGGAPLADRWGHRFFVRSSMLAAAIFFPLIFFVEGALLFVVLLLLGMILISTFSVTVVMAQRLLPRNLGIASGLMVGLAIGTGGIGITLLGVVADHLGVPFALKSIFILPIFGFILSMILQYPLQDRT